MLEVASKKLSIKGYRPSEKGKDPEGDLRYVQMSVDPNSEYDQKVQVVLVWNAANFKDAGALLPKLVKLLRQRSDLFHSIRYARGSLLYVSFLLLVIASL